MIHLTIRALELVAMLGAVSGVGFYCLCLWSAVAFLREQKTGSGSAQMLPRVSILKPLKGIDPEMYESFRSHCLQDYPEYEIIFGVSDPNDPSIGLVERLQQEFPKSKIQLVVCRERLGANVKVSNLVQMLRHAAHDCLIVNDSDIRVDPSYLRQVVGGLLRPRTAMVTCLYRGVPEPTLGSRLESLGISTDFSAGVLAARALEGIRFGLGSTLAFRRRDLESIGGFEAFVDYLADDYELGNQMAKKGLGVELSDVVVDTYLPAYTFKDFLDHQLRWARSVRDSRNWGYIGFVCTFGLFWGVLTLLLAHGATWAWWLLGVIVVIRAATAWVVGWTVLRDPRVLYNGWLLPFRDLLAVIIWAASFAGHSIAWRGDSFTLKDGKLARKPT
jgi:ceramide glucosyltransferase